MLLHSNRGTHAILQVDNAKEDAIAGREALMQANLDQGFDKRRSKTQVGPGLP